MWTDPIVDETRRIRDEHARKFNYDLRAIFEDLKHFEESLAASPPTSDAKGKSGIRKKVGGKTRTKRSRPRIGHCAI